MIAGLILAAGESSRMGRDKALLAYRDRTFLETIVRTLHHAGIDRVAVVLGHHAEEIRRAVNLAPVEVVINPEYQHGQTSSLQAGLRTLVGPDLEAVLLALVDHPAVTAETVRALVAAFRQTAAAVVVPTYESQRGHPVLIGRPVFDALEALTADTGADTVIRNYRDATHFVEVDDAGIVLDVDDADSYRRLQMRSA